jgi:hypothetical protein
MGRPVGVTILAILYFLFGLLCIVGGIGLLAGGGFMASMINQQGGQGAGFLAGLGAALGVGYLVGALIELLLGWGLWKLKNWARIITLIFMAIGAVFSVIGLVGTLTHFNIISLVFTLIFLAIYALIIWYLLRADVKAAFQGGQAKSAAA